MSSKGVVMNLKVYCRSPAFIVAECIVLEVLVGCHGCNKEQALEGG